MCVCVGGGGAHGWVGEKTHHKHQPVREIWLSTTNQAHSHLGRAESPRRGEQPCATLVSTHPPTHNQRVVHGV